jgi:hypothetical protein
MEELLVDERRAEAQPGASVMVEFLSELFTVAASYTRKVDGDASVRLDGYPIPFLPPSGVMQVAAYEALRRTENLPQGRNVGYCTGG